MVTLSAQLEREGVLERAGAREFVHTLAEFVPAAANAAHYAGIVREQSVLRALIRVGNEIADAIKDARGFTIDKRKVLLEESIFEAIKDGRGQVLVLKNEDYRPNFNPVLVPADPVENPRSTGGRSPPAPSNPL